MKTVPHIVEEKHLKMFHPNNTTTGIKRKASRTPAQAPARKKRKPVKRSQKKQKRSLKKKTIKGRVTKKSRQSVVRRQRGNFKDIFSR